MYIYKLEANMETYVIKNHKLFRQNKAIKELLYEDVMKTDISVIGYSDLSHEEAMWRPSEILVGTRSRLFGNLSRLIHNRATGNYQLKLYSAAPADIDDILPVYLNNEITHTPNGRGLLVATNSGIWLVNLTIPVWKQVIGQQVLKIYAEDKENFSLRFVFDQEIARIKILMLVKNRYKSKSKHGNLSETSVGLNQINPAQVIAEVDITSNLLNLGIKLTETLAYVPCFVTQYN